MSSDESKCTIIGLGDLTDDILVELLVCMPILVVVHVHTVLVVHQLLEEVGAVVIT